MPLLHTAVFFMTEDNSSCSCSERICDLLQGRVIRDTIWVLAFFSLKKKDARQITLFDVSANLVDQIKNLNMTECHILIIEHVHKCLFFFLHEVITYLLHHHSYFISNSDSPVHYDAGNGLSLRTCRCQTSQTLGRCWSGKKR